MSESSAPEQLSSRDGTTQRLTILEDLGNTVIDVVHFIFKKARKLPFPVGKSVAYAEDTLGPLLQPLIANAEEEGLHLLALADNKINAASDAAVNNIPLASVLVTPLHVVLSGQALDIMQKGLETVRRRGVVGCTADAWVEYEPVVKNKCQGVYKLVNKVPGSFLVEYVLHDIGSPWVSRVSQWLINQSEKKCKHEHLFADREMVSSHIGCSIKETNDVKSAEDAYPPTQEVVNDSQKLTADVKADCSMEATKGCTSEISVIPVEEQKQESPSDDHKGKLLHVTPPDDDLEEHDDILDLFNTWGLGGNAISPKGLQNLRTMSMRIQPGFNASIESERSVMSKPVSKSFRL
ncbi:hypothetical protein MPTK1_5g08640 [Marchantia polymorpha subsp. ruderalis]|uniref:Uncharacterized protein n=2 Tax=Marchantia polymorpha TaxID=3197 RepID=A0AAF6BGB8_MARPO|nr:hypothetical protein MARPO_0086s0069 [Marchantia polymorpha]BBN11052.1 hypothetical protein Mp_5g08640 [Marchantia polymorpha subsp. ruderalis]|eukprot:PTQ33751.1 hypothetical protein MARPO_0086s0069 [Marchantia polymorpha]